MPYKSDIVSSIFLEKQKDLDILYNKIENKCIQSNFKILNKKNINVKTDFYDLVLNNINLKNHH